MKATTFGLDLAKRVFQVHSTNMEAGETERRQFKWERFVMFVANRAPTLIVMESCGSAHYWAGLFVALGHQLSANCTFVRPFLKRNKTGVANAQSIWEAVRRPEMRVVAGKSEAQQRVLALQRVREQLVKMCRVQIKEIHHLLNEFGVPVQAGRHATTDAAHPLTELANTLPAMMIETLREQLQCIEARNARHYVDRIPSSRAATTRRPPSGSLPTAQCDRSYCHDRRCKNVPPVPRVRGVHRTRAEAKRHWRAREVTRNQQTRWPLFARAVDS